MKSAKQIWEILREILVLIILGWAVVNLSKTGRFPAGDGPHILGVSTRLAQLLTDGEWTSFVYCFSSLLGPHPPFAYLPYMLAELLFPNQGWTHLLGSTFVLWVSWNGVARLGGGIIGFIWLVCGAPIWLQYENAGIDLAAGACAIQATSWLWKSEQLTKRKETFIWGIWLGVGFMVKYTAPMFMWGPCILAGYWVLKRSAWSTLFVGILGFSIVALPWWSTHIGNVMGYVSASSNAGSGLLTNQNILTGPWYEWDRLSWYPAVLIDAYGMMIGMVVLGAILIRIHSAKAPLLVLTILGGWIFLNAQSQRQDRYIVPAIPALAATISTSWLAIPSLYYAWPTLQGTFETYTSSTPAPAQREYTHSIDNAGVDWPLPPKAYWPVSLDTDVWGVDDALVKTRSYQGSDYGTVGFLLDESSGAPGFGAILRRATALGYRWHIATVMVVRPSRNMGPNQPLASIFVGPFTFGSWPSRDFDVLLMMVKRPDPQREKWLKSTGMTLAETWKLPKGRTAYIYTKKLANQIK